MLKPSECAGYVIVSAAKARLDSVEHPPIWRDARLLTKSSLVGQMECMQYYATVGGVSFKSLFIYMPEFTLGVGGLVTLIYRLGVLYASY